jgi:DNA invertase Pin-like site-specific DNA recombinase
MGPGAIYARISDDREGRELGVDDQVRQGRALARREGIKVDKRHVYVDNDLFASDVKRKGRKSRPGYDRMLADAREGKFKWIISLSSSRITRRPRENEDLIDLAVDHGIRYRFVKSPSFDLNTADGRMVARTLAAADAAEAERTAERVRDAVVRRARSGDPHGSARAYGISADGRSLVDAEAEMIRRWYTHIIAGGSVRGLCTEMNDKGILSPNRKPWRAFTVRRILLSERNAGIRKVTVRDPQPHEVEYRTPHAEIVPLDTYKAARAILGDGDRHVRTADGRVLKAVTSSAPTARLHLGTGLYGCERCNRPINSAYDKRGNLLYKCLHCWRSWRADRIDTWICAAIEEYIRREDAAERLLVRTGPGGIDVDALRTEATAIKQNMTALAADVVLLRGQSRTALLDGLEAGERRLAEINAELAEGGRTNPLATILLADDPVKGWRAITDLARRQAVVRALMTVVLGPPIRGRAKWTPMFMGASRWVGDTLTWAEIWAGEGDSVVDLDIRTEGLRPADPVPQSRSPPAAPCAAQTSLSRTQPLRRDAPGSLPRR